MHATSTLSKTLRFLLLVAPAGCFPTPDTSAQIQQGQANVQHALQAAATGQVSGTLNVNSAPYAAIRCSAGQPSGFNGVDVFGANGSRIRFVSETDGTSTVIYSSPGTAPTSTTMKSCSTLNVKPSGVVVNGVNMVDGNAKLDCKTDSLHIDGFVGFGCG